MEIKPAIFFDFDVKFYGDEIEMKGYCDNVEVILPDRSKYRVCFYDPVRLKQDIEEEIYIDIPNLIVILTVTEKNMERAVYRAWEDGFFNNLKSSSV